MVDDHEGPSGPRSSFVAAGLLVCFDGAELQAGATAGLGLWNALAYEIGRALIEMLAEFLGDRIFRPPATWHVRHGQLCPRVPWP